MPKSREWVIVSWRWMLLPPWAVMTGRNTPFSSSKLATQRFRTSGLNIKTRSSPEFQSRNAAHNISGYSIHTKPARPDAIRHQCLGVSTSTDRHERETQRLLLVQATTLLPSQHARQRPFYQSICWRHRVKGISKRLVISLVSRSSFWKICWHSAGSGHLLLRESLSGFHEFKYM
jgi:hypothetical protein